MLRTLFIVMAMLVGSNAFAQRDGTFPRHDCSIYDGDQWSCQRDPSCSFDQWSGRCDDDRRGGGGGTTINCRAYNNDPRGCNAQTWCTWDAWSNRCTEFGSGGGGGGRPTACWQIGNQRQCNQQWGCEWDRWQNACVNDNGGGGGGGGGGGRQTWECSAVDEGWEEHRPHVTQGRSYQDAQYAALDLCERYHGRCVIQDCRQVR